MVVNRGPALKDVRFWGKFPSPNASASRRQQVCRDRIESRTWIDVIRGHDLTAAHAIRLIRGDQPGFVATCCCYSRDSGLRILCERSATTLKATFYEGPRDDEVSLLDSGTQYNQIAKGAHCGGQV